MRIENRTLILSLLIGLVILSGCAIVYFLSAPPPGGAPAAFERTAPPPSALPTSNGPGLTAQPFDSAQGGPALPERRRLTVEFPSQIRTGDSDEVRLTLGMDDLRNLTPTAEIGSNVVTEEIVEIPNLYESHQVIVEARFDLAGMEVRPGELVSEALSPGSTVTFRWNVRPQDAQEAGLYRGTIWLYLRFVHRQSGEESRRTVSAQIVEIEAVNLFGLSGDLARTTGVVGLIVGTIVGFPLFEDIIEVLFTRRNRQK
ncbi:MAG TPA: hypothetical protein VGK56_12985 [Anaerolineales bacterium]